jgi:putative addiction module component (TIGR02574 family)
MAESILPFDINQYSIPERVAMIGEIWDSMAEETSVLPLTDAQKALLDQRIAELDANPDDVIPWTQIERERFGEGQ